jgi:nucleoside 2-deoxyribosyltransferase
MSAPRVYLAGPDVFLPNAVLIAEAKRNICAKYGLIGVSPTDNEIGIGGLPKREAALRISAANEEMIRSCQLLIANLTPFRGPSADVGTAYELGFALALGMPVFGYTNEGGNLVERTRRYLGSEFKQSGPDQFEDPYGMVVENFDSVDNLMLVGAVHASGTEILVHPAPQKRRFTDLAGFEICVQHAGQKMGVETPHQIRRTSLSR